MPALNEFENMITDLVDMITVLATGALAASLCERHVVYFIYRHLVIKKLFFYPSSHLSTN